MSADGELKISRMFKKCREKRLSLGGGLRLREFVLRKESAAYFEVERGSRGKLKGTIYLSSIKFVEKIREEDIDNESYGLQIGYVDNVIGSSVSILYAISNSEEEVEDWIQLLRHYMKEKGATLQPRYHPGIWFRAQGKYGCCGDVSRVSMGCALVESVVESGPRECESVVALYDFSSSQDRQLSLKKGERYIVVDSGHKEWWYLRDESGKFGYAPQSYVQGKDELTTQPWFFGDMSRQEAESLLNDEAKEGCFIVRSSTSGGLTLSLTARNSENIRIHHYRIKESVAGTFFIGENYTRASVTDLIECHRHNSGGLIVRLRSPPSIHCDQLVNNDLGLDEFEVNVAELVMDETIIGRGQFGLVRRGTFRGMTVAIKVMLEDTMNEDDFIDEARNMRGLNHPNLVRLFAVVLKTRPVMIVTEYMRHGSLRDFLRNHYAEYASKVSVLSDACRQVSHAMFYLEQRNFVHRDLASRNVLVNNVDRRHLQVKVADFGMTRFLLDNVYEPSAGTKFPVRWAAPEVFQSVYTSRADVWSFGVFVWEVFTSGLQVPYLGQSNAQVYKYVMGGGRLSKPSYCPDRLYVLMLECWQHEPNKRPGFQYISSKIVDHLQLYCDK